MFAQYQLTSMTIAIRPMNASIAPAKMTMTWPRDTILFDFQVNAAGTQYDGTLFNNDWDESSWDGVWEGSAKTDAQGWTCEMRIPFSQMRFPASAEARTVWGFNVKRLIFARAENDWWIARPRGAQGRQDRPRGR